MESELEFKRNDVQHNWLPYSEGGMYNLSEKLPPNATVRMFLLFFSMRGVGRGGGGGGGGGVSVATRASRPDSLPVQ